MDFDAAAARKAGYSDDEILSYLSKSFDVESARKAGYSSKEIVDFASSGGAAPRQELPPSALSKATSIGAPAPIDRSGGIVDMAFAPFSQATKEKIKSALAAVPILGSLSQASVSDAIETLPEIVAMVGGAAAGAATGGTGVIPAAGVGRMTGQNLKNYIRLGLDRTQGLPKTAGAAVADQALQFAVGAGEQALGDAAFHGVSKLAGKVLPEFKTAAQYAAEGPQSAQKEMMRRLGGPVLEDSPSPMKRPATGFLSSLYERSKQRKFRDAAMAEFNDAAGKLDIPPIVEAESKAGLMKQIQARLKSSDQLSAGGIKSANIRQVVADSAPQLKKLGMDESFNASKVGRSALDKIEANRKASPAGANVGFAEEDFGKGRMLDPSSVRDKIVAEIDDVPLRNKVLEWLKPKKAQPEIPEISPMPRSESAMKIPIGKRAGEDDIAAAGDLDVVDASSRELVSTIDDVMTRRRHSGGEKSVFEGVEMDPKVFQERQGITWKDMSPEQRKALKRGGETDPYKAVAQDTGNPDFSYQTQEEALADFEERAALENVGSKGARTTFDRDQVEVVDQIAGDLGMNPTQIREALIKDKSNPDELKIRRYLHEKDPFDVGVQKEELLRSRGFNPDAEPVEAEPSLGSEPARQTDVELENGPILFGQWREALRKVGEELGGFDIGGGMKLTKARKVRLQQLVKEGLREQMAAVDPERAAAYDAAIEGYKRYSDKFGNKTIKKLQSQGFSETPEKIFSIKPDSAERLRRIMRAAGSEGKSDIRSGFLNAQLLSGGIERLPKNLQKWSPGNLEIVFGKARANAIREVANEIRTVQSRGSSARGLSSRIATLQQIVGEYQEPTSTVSLKALAVPGGLGALGASGGLLFGNPAAGALLPAASEAYALGRTMSAYADPLVPKLRSLMKAPGRVMSPFAGKGPSLPVLLDAEMSVNDARQKRERKQKEARK